MSTELRLKEAAEYLGIEPHSFRTQVRKGKIHGEKINIGKPGGAYIPCWVFSKEALDEYAANRGSVGARSDGRNKFSTYYTEEELAIAIKALKAAGLSGPCLPVRANPPKSKK